MKLFLSLFFFLTPLILCAQSNGKVILTPGISYQHTFFDQVFTPWNSVTTSIKIERDQTTLIPSFSYSERFNIRGTQIGLESYQELKNHDYVMGLLSYSNAQIFPEFKLFGEYFFNRSKREFSVGARYMKFNNPVFLLTASSSLYWKNYFTTLRPTLVIDNNNTSMNISLNHRWFYVEPSFVNFSMFYGYSTDQNLIYRNNKNQVLSSTFGANISFFHKMGTSFSISAGYGIQHWDPAFNAFTWQHDLSIGISKQFK